MSTLLIITGASRGIGLAVARRFLHAGASVLNLSRTPCPAAGVRHVPIDLGDLGAVEALHDTLCAATGGHERVVLVHNAAALDADTVRDTDAAVLTRTLTIGVTAPSVLNRILLPQMKRGSSILYVGSTLSEKGVPGVYSYVISKHAVVGMMRATCQDLLGSGVHTACICPGVTDTEILRLRTEGHPEVLERLRAMTGEGRLIEPDEIAAVLAFAADHPVLNGAVLHANLGQREH